MSEELPDFAKHISYDRTRAGNTVMDPTGVALDITSLSNKEVNTDKIIIQTLEGYVLPLLPTVPLSLHNIHLKCETVTEYYQKLKLPSYKKNIGKYQILEVEYIPVSYVFYPNGTIDIYARKSERPFGLQTEEDRAKLIAFIRKIKDNLPPQVAVPEIEQWEFTECDINRDVRISDLLHISCVKVQVKHMDHLFRVYIKKVGNDTFCRVEETKRLRIPIVEAIDYIFNPYERIERQLAEIQRLLNVKEQEVV